MTATGEIVDGKPHIHAVMAVQGDRAICGHLHRAQIDTSFARAYVIPSEFRAYGNENWEFDENGLMRRRCTSINDLPVTADKRRIATAVRVPVERGASRIVGL